MKKIPENKNTTEAVYNERNLKVSGLCIVMAAALMLLTFCGAGIAKISEPQVTFFGFAKDKGVTLTLGTVTLKINSETAPIATYALGSNTSAAGKFILVLPMDAVDPRSAGTARPGDKAYFYVNGKLAGTFTVPERGTVVHLDVDTSFSTDSNNDGIPDLWAQLYPGNDGSGDMNGNGITDLQDWLNGNDPAACVWTQVDATHNTTCVFHPLVLQNCLSDAGGDLMHNLINLVKGSYIGNFVYSAQWGENFDLEVIGGYENGCASRAIDPAITILDGDNKGAVLSLDALAASTSGAIRVEGISITNGSGMNVAAFSGTVTIFGNIISGNITGSGAGLAVTTESATADIINNMIYKNTTDNGGGVELSTDTGHLSLVNNTIADNSSVNSGAGLMVAINDPSAVVDIINNIIYGNTKSGGTLSDFLTTGSGVMQVLNNDFGETAGIPGWASSTGNISADPMFIDTSVNDYGLRTGSPCIDTGNTLYAKIPATDFEGDSRVAASSDIGADEHQENQLSVVVNEYGSVTSAPSGIDACTNGSCNYKFGEDLDVILTAKAIPGSVLYGFTGCDVVNGNDCIVSMKKARSVTVEFHDVTGPDVSITSTAGDPTKDSPISVTVTFTEAVTGFTSDDVKLVNADMSGFNAVSGTTYAFNVAPKSNGVFTVDIGANVAQDASGNGNTGATQFSRTYDTVPPTVAITSSVGDPTNASSIPVTVTFSKSVTGFESSDVKLVNADISDFNAVSGTTYTFNAAPKSNGVFTIDVAANVAQDAAGNGNAAATQFSRTYDTVQPTVAITSTEGNPTKNSPIAVTVTFSEAVTGFADTKVTVGNADIIGFNAVSGTTYTFNVAPKSNGVFTVDVAANVAQDAAGNGNTAATQFSRTYDTVPPSVAITSTEGNPTKNSPIAVTVTFSEAVTGFADTKVTVGNADISDFRAVSGTTYTFNVAPKSNGVFTVDVGANVAQDAAGNGNTAATQFSRTYDTVGPSVAITSTAGDPTNASSIAVTVTFTEAVTGFAENKVTLGNADISGFNAVSGTTYTFNVKPILNGVFTVDVGANVAQDAAGNGNTAATQFSRTYDTVRPSVAITSTAGDPTKDSLIPVKVVFSEAVNGFTSDDVKLGNADISGFTPVSGTTYTFNIKPVSSGIVTVDVAADAAQDAAGNGNTAAAQLSRTFDNIPPVSVITVPKNGGTVIANTLQAAGTASDVGSRVVKVEVQLNEGDWKTADGTTSWSFMLTGLKDGLNTIRSRATDIAGNVETVKPSVTVNVYYRTPLPVVLDGGQLKVNGRQFTVKGVVYSPVPIGEDPETMAPYGDYFTSNYSGIYNRDLPLLRKMNANTVSIRMWDGMADHRDFLDKAYNGGLFPVYVIAGYWINPGKDLSNADVRERIKTDFRGMVGVHKNHPAILMWSIGYELNSDLMYGGSKQDLFSLINEMAAEAHDEDPNHPVTTQLADIDLINTINGYDASMTELDIWGANVIRGNTFGTLFDDYRGVSAKPLIILEYGIDAFDHVFKQEYEAIGTPYQAEYAEALWSEIAANASTCVGGTIMEYSDEWYRGNMSSDGICPKDIDPAFHGVCGYYSNAHPDGYSNEEWWGIMRPSDAGTAPDVMTPREVYNRLQKLFWSSDEAIKINGVDAYTKSASVTLTLTARPGTTLMCISNTPTCTIWLPYATTKAWSLTTGDGLKTVYVTYKDGAGAFNAVPYTDTITLDTTMPMDGAVVAKEGNAQVRLNWGGFSDALSGLANYRLVYSASSTPLNCSSGTVLYEGSRSLYAHMGLINGTTYYYRVCVMDKAGNMSAGATVSARPREEFVPPVGSITINGGAAFTNTAAVTLGLAATDASGVADMCISNTTTCAAWISYAATKSWSLTSGDGPKTVYVWFRDKWGNDNPTPYSAQITLDTTPPVNGTVTAVAGNGQVQLSWGGFTDAGIGLASYKAVFSASGAPSSCSTGTALYSGNGTSFLHTGLTNGTVYYYRVCATDKLGNMSGGTLQSARPLPEFDPPAGSVIINGGAAFTSSVSVTLALSATDVSGVADMCISNTTTCATWMPYTTTKAWTLTSGDGVKTVYVWFRDKWGTANPTPYSDQITLDTTPPVNGTVAATPGNAQVQLNWGGFADPGSGIAYYRVVYSTTSTPASCMSGTIAGTFDGVASTYIHKGLTNGTVYYYRVCAIDRLGFVSTGATVNARPLPEFDPPAGSITINGGTDFTNAAAVTLALSATDASGVTDMCISNTTTCTAWIPYAVTKSWTLISGDGVKTVYVWFRDKWGTANLSPYSDQIILDTAPPANGSVAATAGVGKIQLNWSGFTDSGSGIAGYKAVFSTSGMPSSCSAGTVLYSGVDTTYTHNGLTFGTVYYYRVCAIDGVGSVSSGVTVSASPVPEADPPTGSITINGGTPFTNTAAVTLGLTATDASGVSGMCISNTTTCSTWIPHTTTKAWGLSSGDGAKTVYVWFRDSWGTANPTPYSAQITLDTAPPVNGSVGATAGVGQVQLNWSGFADTGSGVIGYRVVFATGAPPTTCLTGTVVPGYDGVSTGYTHTGLSTLTYGYRVCAIDKAGNISTGATVTSTPF